MILNPVRDGSWNIIRSARYILKSFLWIFVGSCYLFVHNDLHYGRVKARMMLAFFVIASMHFFESICESCLQKGRVWLIVNEQVGEKLEEYSPRPGRSGKRLLL